MLSYVMFHLLRMKLNLSSNKQVKLFNDINNKLQQQLQSIAVLPTI